jgi:ArsR family transcriptional regulator
MNAAAALYRLLGDEVRLRLLRVLSTDRFNVTELTGILGIAQSGVSRHLGLLRESGLVTEERTGGFAYYRLARPMSDDARDPLWRLLRSQFAATAEDRHVRADQARVQEVLRLRKESFNEHRGRNEVSQLVPGRSWAAWARALGHLLPPLQVADLGCGEGYLTLEAARWARRVIAVDRSQAVLTRARALARRRGVTNVTWRRGTLEKLPLAAGSVDLALLSQSLHHAADPEQALSEAVRVVTPGGRVLILDLRTHDQAWVRDQLGDLWLGFTEGGLSRLLVRAGLIDVKLGVGASRAGGPFTVLVASGTKPARGVRGARRPLRPGPARASRTPPPRSS